MRRNSPKSQTIFYFSKAQPGRGKVILPWPYASYSQEEILLVNLRLNNKCFKIGQIHLNQKQGQVIYRI